MAHTPAVAGKGRDRNRSARWHSRETLAVAGQRHPRLGTVAEDLGRRLDPARVIERADKDHRYSGHRLRLVHQRGAAFRTEDAVQSLAAVAFVGISLGAAGNA